MQMLGVDDDAPVTVRDGALHMCAEIAVEHGLCDVILERPCLGPFETGQRIGEQRDTPPVTLDDVVWVGLRFRVAHEIGENTVGDCHMMTPYRLKVLHECTLKDTRTRPEKTR